MGSAHRCGTKYSAVACLPMLTPACLQGLDDAGVECPCPGCLEEPVKRLSSMNRLILDLEGGER